MKRGFTLIEILVVITILVVLATVSVAAFQGWDRSKVRDGARIAQAALLGARDRALHAGGVNHVGIDSARGVRLIRDPGNTNFGTGFVYVQRLSTQNYAGVMIEYLDLCDATGAAGTDGKVETVRIHGYGVDWSSLNAEGFFATPKMLQFPLLNGGWREWFNLQSPAPNEWTVDTWGPTDAGAPGVRVNVTDLGANVQFMMTNEILPAHSPITLPSGIVVDVQRSSTFVQRDLLFSPRGTITGAMGGLGPIHYLLRDVRDASKNLDPTAAVYDQLVLTLFPQTGLVAVFEVDLTDTAPADGVADDLFRFAKLGATAGR